MATTNDITGDKLITKTNNDAYRDNYDRIFGKKKEKDNASGTTADGSTVSVSSVSGATSTGSVGGVRDNDTEGSTSQG